MAADPASWTDLKHRSAWLEHAELLDVIKDLYDYSAPNRNFLAARFLQQVGREAALDRYALHQAVQRFVQNFLQ